MSSIYSHTTTTVSTSHLPHRCYYSENYNIALPNRLNGGNEYFYVHESRLGNFIQYERWLLDINRNTQYISRHGHYYRVKVKESISIEEPDCLLFAEGMTRGNPFYTEEASQFRVRDIRRSKKSTLFGEDYENNICLSRMVNDPTLINEYANPRQGEAYAVVCQGESEYDEFTPYHIAFVLFEDGRDRLTIEVDAGNKEQKRPLFDLYSIGLHGVNPSFHTRYESMYMFGSIRPITIVLAPVNN
jgi:hypothetical protein